MGSGNAVGLPLSAQPTAATAAEIDAAWDALADEREQALRDGTVAAVPLDVAMARLEARFPVQTPDRIRKPA
jgi:hypothetical protein